MQHLLPTSSERIAPIRSYGVTGSQWPNGQPTKRAVLAARAKYLATQAALMVTSKAITCVGGRSVHKNYPLERMFRDIRTCTLMPPNLDRSMEIIGKAELGMGDKLFSDERVG